MIAGKLTAEKVMREMATKKEFDQKGIQAAKNGDIPVGCEYTTCEACGTDTICQKVGVGKNAYWVCEWCFYNNI
jgi:hypothetical protein